MKTKMTRQQRRKIERDMKKKNKRTIQKSSEPVIYSSTLVHWETLRTTGHTMGSYLTPEEVSILKKNDTVCESIFFVDTENQGRTTPSVVRILHDSEDYGYNHELIQNLLMMELQKLIHSDKNKSPQTLNGKTVFTLVMCKTSKFNTEILKHLFNYVKESIHEDVELSLRLNKEFKKVS